MHKQFALLSQIDVCIKRHRCTIHTFVRFTVHCNANIFNFQRPPGSSPVTGPTCWSCLVLFPHKVTTRRDACEVIALYTMTSMCQFHTYYVCIYFPLAYQALFGSWHSLNCYYRALNCRHSTLCNMNLFIYR